MSGDPASLCALDFCGLGHTDGLHGGHQKMMEVPASLQRRPMSMESMDQKDNF